MLLIAIEVRASAIHGLGVFAREAVPEGKIVWQFDPGIDQRHPVAWLAEQPEHVRRYVGTYGVLSLDRTYYHIPGDQTVFVNHSATPSLKPREDIVINGDGIVVAARDLAVGEELTINYGEIDGADRDKLARGLSLF